MRKVLILIGLVISLFGGVVDNVPKEKLAIMYSHGADGAGDCVGNDDSLYKMVTRDLNLSKETVLEEELSNVVSFILPIDGEDYHFYYFNNIVDCKAFIEFLAKNNITNGKI